MIEAVRLNQIGDKLVQAYLNALGTTASGLGIGADGDTFGVQDKLADILAYLVATEDSEVQADLSRAFLDAQDDFTALKVCGARFASILSRLDSHARKRSAAASISGVSSLDTLQTYWNTTHATKWQALWPPEWYALFNAIRGGTRYPSPENVYFEVLQGSTYANALGKFEVTGAGTGNFTNGAAVDYAKYAGGHPSVLVSSFGGSSDTVTVTGLGFDPATQTVTASVTFTFTVAGNGRAYRAAGSAPTDSLIVDVTGIAAGNNITAGTIYVEAERPVVRSGTSQAGAATTITLDAGASAEDEFYTGLTIGQAADRYTTRTITGYVGSTKVATVNSAWASNPSTTAFKIYRTKPS